MPQPHLTFFCELEADAVRALFANSAVIDDLVALQAGVSLGIPDLSRERAEAVRQLNRAGVPVIAWLLLPKNQGYWLSLNNAAQAAERYAHFKAWSAEHDLRWAGVGLDIEFDWRELQQALTNAWRLLPTVLLRSVDNERLRRAQVEYSALVAQMRADGHRVESYVIPFILDERQAGAALLQRLAGLVDVPADREVPMLYSSLLRPRGPGFLWSYAQQVQAVGVGSTGGGVQIEGASLPRPLDWNELARDLRLARRWVNEIYIFSLEGCVEQGFLRPLRDFDWEQAITPPLEMAAAVERFRKGLRGVLWLSAHPWAVVGGLLGLWWLRRRLR